MVVRTQKEMIYPFHLEKEKLVNLGAFYTSPNYVNIVWHFIEPIIDEKTVIFDPACGYGNFLIKETIARKIGNDIDKRH
jgi:type I restriction-modification system DNA methylase subunit